MIAPVDAASRRLAVAAESLYLANLLIAPGLAFLILLWLWRRAVIQGQPADSLARRHLRQTLAASLWAGALLLGLGLAILLIGGLSAIGSWMLLILYFICVHSALVLFGLIGLSRALAGQPFRFPLIGLADPLDPR